MDQCESRVISITKVRLWVSWYKKLAKLNFQLQVNNATLASFESEENYLDGEYTMTTGTKLEYTF